MPPLPDVKVFVKEKIGDSGVQLLRDAGFEVELGVDWEDGELDRRIGEFDGILIRSATQLTGDLIERADRLKAVGRAGVGVDNVDVDAATKRGVVVANAPQSDVSPRPSTRSRCSWRWCARCRRRTAR